MKSPIHEVAARYGLTLEFDGCTLKVSGAARPVSLHKAAGEFIGALGFCPGDFECLTPYRSGVAVYRLKGAEMVTSKSRSCGKHKGIGIDGVVDAQ